MTLQDCKDEVARKHNWTNWDNLCFVWAGFIKQIEPFMEEAAELYAEYKWDQACEEQKEKCAQAYYNNENNLDEDVAIRRASKPVFKP